MARHQKIIVKFPEWVRRASEENPCLASVAEDVYYAKALVEAEPGHRSKACVELISAGMKSLRVLENQKASSRMRCSAGDRAARKFWEAKVCARRA